MRYVGVGRRALALLIDSLLLVVPIALVLADRGSTIASFPESDPVTASHTMGVLNAAFGWLTLLWFAYMIMMEATYGATMGKFALGIRVVKFDGSPVDVVAAIIRNLLRAVDGQLGGLIGAIIIWNSSLRQRLGDKAAGTVVVPTGVAREIRAAQLARSGLPPVSMQTPPRPD